MEVVLIHLRDHSGGLRHAFWAACGTIVIAYIFLSAFGALDPTEAEIATIVVLALAVLWTAHSWRDLWREERQDR